jgi:hypothetical protein
MNIPIDALFIVHQEWTDSNWPNLILLKNIGLICTFVLFGILVFIPILTLFWVSLPYGWPAVTFFKAVPQSQQIFVFAAIITGFFLPLLISCVLYVFIYIAVITKHLNRVGTSPVEEVPNLSEDIGVDSSQFGENVIEEEALENKERELKTKAERLSALRALKTNLCFIIIFIFPLLILWSNFTLSNSVFFCTLYYSANKCVMTVATAIVNFGPIREILSKFWTALKKRKSDFFNSRL